MDWNSAENECAKSNAHLASVHSDAEMEFITKLQNSNFVAWIGAQREGEKFKWNDGSKFDFINWNVGEPNHRNRMENCVEFYSRSEGYRTALKWNDVECFHKNSYVCKKAKRGFQSQGK